jgi:hypothetical protein
MFDLLRCTYEGQEYIEEFKDINLTAFGGQDYTGYYQVSNFGRIYSLPRVSNNLNGEVHLKGKMKSCQLNHGYFQVSLWKNNSEKILRVHRLVAIAFIPNAKKDLIINHKDGIKKNIFFKNLEWATSSENNYHAYRIGLKTPPKGRKVICIETGTIYKSVCAASRAIGTTNQAIFRILRKKRKTTKGYSFKDI